MVSVCLPSDALLQHLPSYLGFSYLGRGVSLHGCSSKAQLLFLTLDEGYLLIATLSVLQCVKTQGDILTRAEKHFEELKDTSLPLPIWYQDGLTKQWKSGKLILQEKRYAYIFPDRSNKVSWLLLQKIHPQRTTNIQDRKK